MQAAGGVLLLDDVVRLVGFGAGVAVTGTLEAVVTSVPVEVDGFGMLDVADTCAVLSEDDVTVTKGLAMAAVVVIATEDAVLVAVERATWIDEVFRSWVDEVGWMITVVDVGCGRILELGFPAAEAHIAIN